MWVDLDTPSLRVISNSCGWWPWFVHWYLGGQVLGGGGVVLAEEVEFSDCFVSSLGRS